MRLILGTLLCSWPGVARLRRAKEERDGAADARSASAAPSLSPTWAPQARARACHENQTHSQPKGGLAPDSWL